MTNLKTLGTPSHEVFRLLLKKLRSEQNLTQAQLADRLDLPQSYVSKYETGERRLDFIETATICEALGIGLSDFAKTFLARLKEKTSARAPIGEERR